MKPVSFYLVTDTHYFENELGAEGKSFEKKVATEQYFVKESSSIVKSTFARISNDTLLREKEKAKTEHKELSFITAFSE